MEIDARFVVALQIKATVSSRSRKAVNARLRAPFDLAATIACRNSLVERSCRIWFCGTAMGRQADRATTAHEPSYLIRTI